MIVIGWTVSCVPNGSRAALNVQVEFKSVFVVYFRRNALPVRCARNDTSTVKT